VQSLALSTAEVVQIEGAFFRSLNKGSVRASDGGDFMAAVGSNFIGGLLVLLAGSAKWRVAFGVLTVAVGMALRKLCKKR